MTEYKDPNTLKDYTASQLDLLGMAGAQLWQPKDVWRYQFMRILHYPWGIPFFLIKSARAYRVLLACATTAPALLGGWIFFWQISAQPASTLTDTILLAGAGVAFLVGAFLSTLTYIKMSPFHVCMWAATPLLKVAKEKDLDATIATQVHMIAYNIVTIFPPSDHYPTCLTVYRLGKDAMLVAHLPDGSKYTVLVWRGAEVIPPPRPFSNPRSCTMSCKTPSTINWAGMLVLVAFILFWLGGGSLLYYIIH